jgi:ADP-heptose:LPS heptosyltransferase
MELQRLSSNLTAFGYEVTLLGAPNDPSFEQSGVTNLIGKTSLQELVQHVQSSELHIAGDTGSGHIAAAVGTPLLTVWGSMPYERYRPVTMRNSVIFNHDSLNETLTSTALEMLGGNLSES